MTPALAAVPVWTEGDTDHRWVPRGGRGSAARGISADVLLTSPGQGLRREMMGCNLEGGEDAERKQGGFLCLPGVWELFLSVPPT